MPKVSSNPFFCKTTDCTLHRRLCFLPSPPPIPSCLRPFFYTTINHHFCIIPLLIAPSRSSISCSSSQLTSTHHSSGSLQTIASIRSSGSIRHRSLLPRLQQAFHTTRAHRICTYTTFVDSAISVLVLFPAAHDNLTYRFDHTLGLHGERPGPALCLAPIQARRIRSELLSSFRIVSGFSCISERPHAPNMSIQQGLVSPPLSGRTHKADQPRVQDTHKFVDAADVFGRVAQHNKQVYFEQYAHHHTIRSPVKPHDGKLSDAERAERPLTPPMSKDVRHDQQDRDNHDARHRTDSEGDRFVQPASSSSSLTIDVEQAPAAAFGASKQASFRVAASRPQLMPAAPIGNCFGTLNQGGGFESDDEHNPFLDRRPAVASSSTQAARDAHRLHAYHDEFDSDQDAEGSVDGQGIESEPLQEATPRASSSNATTPPPLRARQAVAYRPARRFSERVRVDNESVVSTVPIRDTPKNPFLAGGPADEGFYGPNRHQAYRRARQIPGKERGKIAYVFRGQRVTYADPEYDSDDDDSELEQERARTNEFNPHHNAERPPRLQPRLLFPPSMSIDATQSGSKRARTDASASSVRADASKQMSGRREGASAADVSRSVEWVGDEFGGATSSSSYGEEECYADRRTGGGLFAAQISAQQQYKQPSSHSSDQADEREDQTGACSRRSSSSQERGEAVAPPSSARLQSIIRDSHDLNAGGEARQTARDALLARLDQTNWSDDDDDDDNDRSGDERGHVMAMDERERYQLQAQTLSRSQSQRKRLSDELRPGHEAQVDVLGRPMKRSRASYAY
ncbi:hypothetical protein PHSY_003378 [Pseudozyma hubeiensis SY62]|uniref:Uncharacterized protein n=1 Tax=Pseudozyma hubeiensis (strain SY62) TaxID=1305764 RepID=R9P382_PSEHS|nr:hypothetical protein PHSY_003378 [Pseudozyma hubeiensis SY62]GAC95801.1 hypothetical protein PHSY_003378 [Pseudozyma hubeiensis SY62]